MNFNSEAGDVSDLNLQSTKLVLDCGAEGGEGQERKQGGRYPRQGAKFRGKHFHGNAMGGGGKGAKRGRGRYGPGGGKKSYEPLSIPDKFMSPTEIEDASKSLADSPPTPILPSPHLAGGPRHHVDFNDPIYDEHSKTVPIPTNLIGWVIGRGGKRLKDIMAKTKCLIWIDQETAEGVDDRTCYVRGETSESVGAAISKIKELMKCGPHAESAAEAGADQLTKILDCPKHLVGLIIGNRGMTIKKLSDDSQCLISINQCVGENEPRKIILSGKAKCVFNAEQSIRNMMLKSQLSSPRSQQGAHPGYFYSIPPGMPSPPLLMQQNYYYQHHQVQAQQQAFSPPTAGAMFAEGSHTNQSLAHAARYGMMQQVSYVEQLQFQNYTQEDHQDY
ncbi:hypothetical protein TrVE_jg9279 [Triparma verrucosa]|uniref:K Homology domain-containing protein n=1 Tax=Triparma verrucosa TaxID=1606542 RepID=A0A9W7ESQ6_9STRA|nr:hypothetical protein TrVE_jg9279 [Triparma verrucosa]